jgi:hypothetical protein
MATKIQIEATRRQWENSRVLKPASKLGLFRQTCGGWRSPANWVCSVNESVPVQGLFGNGPGFPCNWVRFVKTSLSCRGTPLLAPNARLSLGRPCGAARCAFGARGSRLGWESDSCFKAVADGASARNWVRSCSEHARNSVDTTAQKLASFRLRTSLRFRPNLGGPLRNLPEIGFVPSKLPPAEAFGHRSLTVAARLEFSSYLPALVDRIRVQIGFVLVSRIERRSGGKRRA